MAVVGLWCVRLGGLEFIESDRRQAVRKPTKAVRIRMSFHIASCQIYASFGEI